MAKPTYYYCLGYLQQNDKDGIFYHLPVTTEVTTDIEVAEKLFQNAVHILQNHYGRKLIRVEERAPTDDEILQSIQEAMENEYPVYATFYLDCGMVVDNKATTLQSSFYVGQRVFYIKNNKIQSKCIFRILLTKTVTADSASDDTIIKEGEESCIRMNYKGCNAYVLANKKFYDSIQRNNCIKYYQMEIVTESEIFASKEELVKHLLED